MEISGKKKKTELRIRGYTPTPIFFLQKQTSSTSLANPQRVEGAFAETPAELIAFSLVAKLLLGAVRPLRLASCGVFF
jgi:hypothetical protein